MHLSSRRRGEPSPELMQFIDKRLAVFQQENLPEHLALLKGWESKLKQVEKWYKTNTEKFEVFVDELKAEYEHKNIPVDVISHDHSYSLKSSEKFVSHACGSHCRANKTLPDKLDRFSPLEIPLLIGWKRIVLKRSGGGEKLLNTYYVAPCGRKLRSMDELVYFLDVTGVKNLNAIHFTFDPLCSVTSTQYNPEVKQPFYYSEDITRGKEKIPISCVNEHNSSKPNCDTDDFEYLTLRTFEPNIPHMTAPEFLVCCNCTDNCMNRSKCECWKLTIEEAKVIGNVRYSVGYVHRRLRRPQHSAVYECNPWCGCGVQCSNRVVQGGINHRLQLFHTGKDDLNWGLRSLDDIPMGTFVCCYIGHVYTEKGAEEEAKKHGDQYFADLDYIEVMEYHKAGYESSVPDLDDDSSIASETSEVKSTTLRMCSTTRKEIPTPTDVIVISSDSEDECSVETCSSSDSTASSHATKSLHPNITCSVSITPIKIPSFLHSNSSLYSPDLPSSPAVTPLSYAPSSTDLWSSTVNASLLNVSSSFGVWSPSVNTPLSNVSSSTTGLQIPGISPHLHPVSHYSIKTRQFYEEDSNYIMDAKVKGNVGRYINHSCDPNLFVQNVFIDTHDLRFPWVAFFTKRLVKAMEELTWDYNYEIGSVENKIMYCKCGSTKCRKRLI